MKLLSYSLIALIMVLQEPAEYPPGSFCSPQGILSESKVIDPDHPCSCQRVDTSEDCEGVPQHDQVCKQWCHEQHCSCPPVCHSVKQEPEPES